eukprot:1039319-Pyramimonas_sp.AAC.2
MWLRGIPNSVHWSVGYWAWGLRACEGWWLDGAVTLPVGCALTVIGMGWCEYGFGSNGEVTGVRGGRGLA